jgi:hypothetical protein
MSTTVSFEGQTYIRPGVYTAIRGVADVQPISASVGNVLIIEGGNGVFGGTPPANVVNYGGGMGISGAKTQDEKSIYQFSTAGDLKAFVGGGLIWDLADYVFYPDANRKGANSVFYARACTTAPAIAALSDTMGNSISLATFDEGSCANGIAQSGVEGGISRGYAINVVDGKTAGTLIFKFYRGNYKGVDENGVRYEDNAYFNTKPAKIVAKSPEVSSLYALHNWMLGNEEFNSYFTIESATTNVSEVFEADDITLLKTSTLFAGGTSSYSADYVDKVLESLEGLNFDSVLMLDKGDSATNIKIASFCANDETKRVAYCGGGETSSEIGLSKGYAASFNGSTVVAHSGSYTKYSSLKTKVSKSSLYTAAVLCGLAAGSSVQVSNTFKGCRIKDLKHIPNKLQSEDLLQSGVLHFRNVTGIGVVVCQEINSVQKNTQIINEDGSSHECSVVRIENLIDKEILYTLRKNFVGEIVSNGEIGDCINIVLKNRIGTLITSGSVISVERKQDYIKATYQCTVNNSINKIFVTGFYTVA